MTSVLRREGWQQKVLEEMMVTRRDNECGCLILSILDVTVWRMHNHHSNVTCMERLKSPSCQKVKGVRDLAELGGKGYIFLIKE